MISTVVTLMHKQISTPLLYGLTEQELYWHAEETQEQTTARSCQRVVVHAELHPSPFNL